MTLFYLILFVQVSNSYNDTCIVKDRHSKCIPVDCDRFQDFYYNGNICYNDIMVNSGYEYNDNDYFEPYCMVSHKYRFVYVSILKNGGMTMQKFLYNILCYKYERFKTSLKVNCDDYILEETFCSLIWNQDNVTEYFVFGFVRNPYKRMISNYYFRSMHKNVKYWRINDYRMPISFDEFVSNPDRMDKYSFTNSNHLIPQYRFILDNHYCPYIDFIGNLDRFNKDIFYVFNIIIKNSDLNDRDTLMNDFMDEYIELTDILKDNYIENNYGMNGMKLNNVSSWKDLYRNISTQNIVYERYKLDFKLFGYKYRIH